MRQGLLNSGVEELEYEIRNIVKKAEVLQRNGKEIYWENIGDPIQKNAQVPTWIKDIVTELTSSDHSYGYTHSKGDLLARQFLAEETNRKNGVQIDENDILFFNGLGDAIQKVYQYLLPSTRIIGPSPAYSTHSSAEAAHAHKEPITYPLIPENHWFPDVEQMRLHVKYNPNIVGILVINPDNPTGVVYPLEVLKEIVAIAKEFDLFIISDEIYSKVTYNGAVAINISEVIGDVPAIAMKGMSKDVPWPGSRCGWMEFYNKDKDKEFARLCRTLEDAKMIEVCSTTLPQLALPKIYGDSRYAAYREEENEKIGRRSRIISEILGGVDAITFNETFGAFYNTIVFKEGVLTKNQKLSLSDSEEVILEEWVEEDTPLDRRFVYYLLASKGVCVVPLSSFHSPLYGFRVTILEENEELLRHVFGEIRTAIFEYVNS